MAKSYVRLDRYNAAVLLVDHQAGFLSLMRDIDSDKLKNNVLALADLAKYFRLPTRLTTSFENGPNGRLVAELKEIFPLAPYIARPGQINAWDNEEFVDAVKATGKKQLIQRNYPQCRMGTHVRDRRAIDDLVWRRLRIASRLTERRRRAGSADFQAYSRLSQPDRRLCDSQ